MISFFQFIYALDKRVKFMYRMATAPHNVRLALVVQ